jgi:hypothetical protein
MPGLPKRKIAAQVELGRNRFCYWFTVCVALAETLLSLLASPEYVAVSVMLPAVPRVILQLPASNVPEQLCPLLAFTVTVPVGFVEFVIAWVTLNPTVTACPTVEGSGVFLVIVVVVPTGLTVRSTSSDTVV